VNGQNHYCLPPLERFHLGEILTLIEQKKYFLLHVPRQTGKTTCLLALMEYLNQEGSYRALYANIEGAQAAREDGDPGVIAREPPMAREYGPGLFQFRCGGKPGTCERLLMLFAPKKNRAIPWS